MRRVSKRSFRIVETMCIEEVECSHVASVQIKYLWYMLKGAKDFFRDREKTGWRRTQNVECANRGDAE